MPDLAPMAVLTKCPTGIAGFDEISTGGLPQGRPTLLAGSAGSGKTLFALEFILRGIEQYGEPGVFVSFEESRGDLATNVASMGFDLTKHQNDGRLRILHIELELRDLIESGDYDLDGLFMRLGAAIDAVAARRMVLDGVENLFSAFADTRILRAEFRRLINWIKDRGVTTVVTTERGTDTITRHGIEEYIIDGVVTLDNRICDQIATRRLRIVKYRGSMHGSDEYPFVLGSRGFTVFPVTSAGLAYPVSTERMLSGIDSLDAMLAGGIYRGSSILITGTAGTGKSSIAAQMADAACRRGEACLYVAFEEAPDQIERNMRSIGLDLSQWRQSGLLRFHAARPTSNGMETHLAALAELVSEFKPALVVIDPVTALDTGGADPVKLLLIRAVDLFKSHGITSLFTALTYGDDAPETTSVAISSLMDIWILLRNLELSGERNRGLYVCKARGIAHSHQVREFKLTGEGIKLIDVRLDDDGRILTGSARLLHDRLKTAEAEKRSADAARRRSNLENRRRVLEAKIADLRAAYEDELQAQEADLAQEDARALAADCNTTDLAARRSDAARDEP